MFGGAVEKAWDLGQPYCMTELAPKLLFEKRSNPHSHATICTCSKK